MAGLAGPRDLVVEAELRWQVAPEVVEYGVGGRRQPVEHPLGVGVLEVEGDALLAAVEALEVDGVLVAGVRRNISGDVPAGVGVLDLDDLRAHVGQVQRAPGACAVLLEGDYADALQGEPGAHLVELGSHMEIISESMLWLRTAPSTGSGRTPSTLRQAQESQAQGERLAVATLVPKLLKTCLR